MSRAQVIAIMALPHSGSHLLSQLLGEEELVVEDVEAEEIPEPEVQADEPPPAETTDESGLVLITNPDGSVTWTAAASATTPKPKGRSAEQSPTYG